MPNEYELTLAEWRENSIVWVVGAFMVCAFIATTAALFVRGVNRQSDLSRALRDANDRYHQTIDSLMDAIVAVDAEHNILLFNPSAEQSMRMRWSRMISWRRHCLVSYRSR